MADDPAWANTRALIDFQISDLQSCICSRSTMPGLASQVIAHLICLAQLLEALVRGGVAPVLVRVVPAKLL